MSSTSNGSRREHHIARALRRAALAAACTVAAIGGTPRSLVAQQGDGALHGRITDSTRAGIAAALIHLSGTTLGAYSSTTGEFDVGHVPSGTYTISVRRRGYAADSFTVAIRAGEVTTRDIVLRLAAQSLDAVIISASPRLNETKEQALDKQRNADNIVTVLSGDVIRSLPNANAAEAAARIPGVSTERDEGEGKFVQIRGTEPRLSNVTVNGVHIPGTQAGTRVAKLDDVPTDILAAIEVSKTLTADQDADAIGGSVNLVTKTPEGAPRGYLAGQFGQSTLEGRNQGQGSAMWGGRFGEQRKLGLLLGGTYDHNNRGINDVELAWDVNDAGQPIPVEWDQRDYLYDRTRWGANGALDYRFDDGSTMFLRGAWTKFQNFGVVYRYDVSAGGDSTLASSGSTGIGTGGVLTRNTSNRTPTEGLYSVNGGGKKQFGNFEVNYGDGTNHDYPTYSYLSAADRATAQTPANYSYASSSIGAGTTRGDEFGGQLDALLHYAIGGDATELKLGAKYRDESRDNVNLNRSFTRAGTLGLTQVLGGFADPNFYQALASGYEIGPQANHDVLRAFEAANPAMFKETTKPISDSLSNFSGGEKVASLYAMQTIDHGPLRVNVGVRMENTALHFDGNVAETPADASGTATGAQTVHRVLGTQNYTDLFPSVQLRYAATANSNIRLAVTKGIARANYSDRSTSRAAWISCPAAGPGSGSM